MADRFHLIKNLVDALEPILDRNKRCLRFTDESRSDAQEEGQASPPQPSVLSQIRPAPSKKAEEARLAQRQVRQERYEQAITLHQQGFKIAEIASRLGVHRRTIERFLAAPSFPEKKRRHAERTKLEAYHSYLWERWQAGGHNASHLFREITTLGYKGSYASVNKYLTCLRTGIHLPATPMSPAVCTLTVKQARFLLFRSPADLQTEEQQDLESILSRSTDVALIYHLAQQFREMLHQRRTDQLEDWLQQALQCPFPELHSFVSGIRKDWKAVVAAFTLKWNNGMVEGHVNRLKLIKRQMYGRAAFDLLRQRVLHCA